MGVKFWSGVGFDGDVLLFDILFLKALTKKFRLNEFYGYMDFFGYANAHDSSHNPFLRVDVN